jgi:hypothetical protein
MLVIKQDLIGLRVALLQDKRSFNSEFAAVIRGWVSASQLDVTRNRANQPGFSFLSALDCRFGFQKIV